MWIILDFRKKRVDKYYAVKRNKPRMASSSIKFTANLVGAVESKKNVLKHIKWIRVGRVRIINCVIFDQSLRQILKNNSRPFVIALQWI